MTNTYIVSWQTTYDGQPGRKGITLIEAPDERSASRKLRSLYPMDRSEQIKVTEVKLYERPGL